MIDPSKPEGRLAAAALKLAAERPWREVTLRDIADAAGMTLTEVRDAKIGSKSQILIAINRAIDREVVAKAPKIDPAQSPRDTLFEVVMSRFDAMQPYRAAIRSILKAADADAGLMRSLLNSQYWMLQAAGIGTEGTRGRLRLAGLASVYAGVLNVWLDDDDPGLARTMAALDRRLRSGERTLQSVKGACEGMRRVGDTLRDMLRGASSRSASSAPPAADPEPPQSNPPSGSVPGTPSF